MTAKILTLSKVHAINYISYVTLAERNTQKMSFCYMFRL